MAQGTSSPRNFNLEVGSSAHELQHTRDLQSSGSPESGDLKRVPLWKPSGIQGYDEALINVVNGEIYAIQTSAAFAMDEIPSMIVRPSRMKGPGKDIRTHKFDNKQVIESKRIRGAQPELMKDMEVRISEVIQLGQSFQGEHPLRTTLQVGEKVTIIGFCMPRIYSSTYSYYIFNNIVVVRTFQGETILIEPADCTVE